MKCSPQQQYRIFCLPNRKNSVEYITEWKELLEDTINNLNTRVGEVEEKLENTTEDLYSSITNINQILDSFFSSESENNTSLSNLLSTIDSIYNQFNWEGSSILLESAIGTQSGIPVLNNEGKVTDYISKDSANKCLNGEFSWVEFAPIERTVGEYTYTEMKSLKDSNSLIPGKLYILKINVESYMQNGVLDGDIPAGTYVKLLVMAASSSTLLEDCYMIEEGTTTKYLTCKYCFDNDYTRFPYVNAWGEFVIIKNAVTNTKKYYFKGEADTAYYLIKDGKTVYNAKKDFNTANAINTQILDNTDAIYLDDTNAVFLDYPGGEILLDYFVALRYKKGQGVLYFLKDDKDNYAPFDFKRLKYLYVDDEYYTFNTIKDSTITYNNAASGNHIEYTNGIPIIILISETTTLQNNIIVQSDNWFVRAKSIYDNTLLHSTAYMVTAALEFAKNTIEYSTNYLVPISCKFFKCNSFKHCLRCSTALEPVNLQQSQIAIENSKCEYCNGVTLFKLVNSELHSTSNSYVTLFNTVFKGENSNIKVMKEMRNSEVGKGCSYITINTPLNRTRIESGVEGRASAPVIINSNIVTTDSHLTTITDSNNVEIALDKD